MRSGSFDARAELCANHYDEMRLYVQHLGLSEEDCEDLVQQIFVVACAPNAVVPESIPEQRTWLCDNALILLRNHEQIEKRQSGAVASPLASSEGMAASPEVLAYTRELLRLLLAGMTPEQQDLLRRYLLEGETVDELSPHLGITRSAVWARVEKLRGDMQAYFAILQSRDQRRT
jgi:DNA-directed RNA polymerase specialized sigma24 family protein